MTQVSLPMYDWPEVSGLWDALWAEMSVALAAFGAPERLDRSGVPVEAALLTQTCGWPLVREGWDVEIVGAFDFGLKGCRPGEYRSVLIEGPGQGPVAVNEMGSQSGYAALCRYLGTRPDEVILTGSHRASVQAVAQGRAGMAAIDAVSWRLAEAHEVAAGACRVVGHSPPVPGLPLVARREGAAMFEALEPVMQSHAATALGISGLVRFDLATYQREMGLI